MITGVGYDIMEDGGARITLSFSVPEVAAPTGETGDNPPRIVLRFQQVGYSLRERSFNLGSQLAQGFSLLADGADTLMVLSLESAAVYSIKTGKNMMVIGLGPTMEASQRNAEPAVSKSASYVSAGNGLLPSINMYKGEARLVPVSPVRQVAVGEGGIVSATALASGQLLLIAGGSGSTNVHLWLVDGTELEIPVYVSETHSDREFRQIKSMLSGAFGVKIRKVDDRVVIDGSLNKETKDKVDLVASIYPRAVNLSQLAKVPMEKMIGMDVKVVEMKTTLARNIGVDWLGEAGTAVSGGLTGTTMGEIAGNPVYRPSPAPGFIAPGQTLPMMVDPFASFFGLAASINAKINLAVTNGDAFILASPSLSARSGGKASFLAGGQIPLPSTNSLGSSSVTFKDYGITLEISPVADNDNNIQANVSTEISTIDASNVVNGIPGFLTRKAQADITVKNGGVIAISGLINSESHKFFKKFPFLGDIPILGALFRSQDFANSRTELVIFVTPKVIDSASQDTQKTIDRAADIENKFNRDFSEAIVE